MTEPSSSAATAEMPEREAAPVAPAPPEGDVAEAEAAMEKAQKLISRIMETQANPNPRLLHTLASLLEAHEARYQQEYTNPSLNNARASHTIGKLANLVRDNDEFYELVFSTFLSETRYSDSVRAATARLLIICSSAFMYPHVFEDSVLDNIKLWVMEDPVASINVQSNSSNNNPTDAELLRTYSVGLLAIALSSGGQVVEDILTSGVSAKLMRFLRVRVLGESSSSQKDVSSLPSTALSSRTKDENRGKARLDPIVGPRWTMDGSESLRSVLTDSSSDMAGTHEILDDSRDIDYDQSDGNSNTLDLPLEVKSRFLDENLTKGGRRGKAKGRGASERALMSPGLNRGSRERNLVRGEDFVKKALDVKRGIGLNGGLSLREENEERLRDCLVGSRDISEIVLKAIRAAESEARAAHAPDEAIRAAGDAAAELVKTTALEVWKGKNDEEAAVSAANEAASTVIAAAMSTDVSRSEHPNERPAEPKPEEPPKEDKALEDFSILEREQLFQLREIYCIQCLEILGEYVEALGPILHEKGVDVCLSLLQRSAAAASTDPKASSAAVLLLPEVLKLICALAAHRKFAALFVDRGGIQKLLEVRRVPQTLVGLSACLFTIGSLQGIMERVSALPSDVVHRVVDLSLQLLECPQDQARKNAAIFFASAFVFRAIIESFDYKDGLHKFLTLLHGIASVRSGGGNPNPNPNPNNLNNDRLQSDVLTVPEKHVAYHTCVALRQYFRAQLLILVDMLRLSKGPRSGARGGSAARASYKPLDISSEAMDAVLLQIQKDRKLGTNLVRARWTVVDKFLALNGHITMLELCQAPPGERYLHDLGQYAFGVLQIVTLVPCSRKLIVNAALSNNRVGMAVIVDAANGTGYVDPEVIRPALHVLINLVCPPPSISNKPSSIQSSTNPQPGSVQPSSCPSSDNNRERNPNSTNNYSAGSSSQVVPPQLMSSGVVGDRRISLGSGAGSAGLAAQLEQGYRQAREAVRANNGIKVLLNLLNHRMITPPGTLDSIRALACRVLLGLAIDDTIAHILTKLQVGKKLSELIRDSSSQPSGGEQGRYQAELTNVAIELIAILTNSGKATTLAATDAAAPALRRIERAAIAAATPISYHSRELLQLIHEHLQASSLRSTAAMLQKEADLTPLPTSTTSAMPGPPPLPPPPLHQTPLQETPPASLHWPSGRSNCTFLHQDSHKTDDSALKSDQTLSSFKKKPLVFSSTSSSSHAKSINALNLKPLDTSTTATTAPSNPNSSMEFPDPPPKTPIVLPMKRKLTDSKDPTATPSPTVKRFASSDLFCHTPAGTARRPADIPLQSPSSLHLSGRTNFNSIPVDNLDDLHYTPGPPLTPAATSAPSHLALTTADLQAGANERMTLDSLVVQYLKHQHRQCPAPITTLPPLSLLHPHVCPEPSRALAAPANVTARIGTREIMKPYSGVRCSRRDRHYVYSRFRPCRTCRDDVTLLTCMAFLGDSTRIATGNHSGELKIFDSNTGNMVESQPCHQTHVTLMQSVSSGGTQLLLSSSVYEVRLWDVNSISGGPMHSFDGCKAARFSHSGASFAALSTDLARREVLLYDVQTCNLDLRLPDSNNGSGGGRGHVPSLIHFSPSDTMLLWNGVLWDRRSVNPVHRFDQFTDYGGGGFHPAGNEVILNSEVWDLRKFKLLRSVPSLDQTVITFNPTGDVIYAILRRNLEDVSSAIQTRRVRHPLFPAFRTIDSFSYSEIATVQVDRCVLDLAVDPTDSLLGVVAMDDHEEMFSSARLYEIGRRRPTDDDSDPDDAGESDEEESDDEGDESDGAGAVLADLAAAAGDTDSEEFSSNDDDDDMDDSDDDLLIDSGDENEDDDEFVDFDAAQGLMGIMADGDADGDADDSEVVESLSSGEEFGF